MMGDRIGPYRVLRTLGAGGMGEVYLAERADAQFEQQVAIKVVHGGLLAVGMHSRLKLERQILAQLDHPNIAHLLDGGALPDGSAYLVMEYVHGVAIDDYCDSNCLDINARLKLFQTVCAAVHYAHHYEGLSAEALGASIYPTWADGSASPYVVRAFAGRREEGLGAARRALASKRGRVARITALRVLAEGGSSKLFAGDITTHGRYGELGDGQLLSSKAILQ